MHLAYTQSQHYNSYTIIATYMHVYIHYGKNLEPIIYVLALAGKFLLAVL